MKEQIDILATTVKATEPKTESISEIKSMREDQDIRLQQAANIATDTKLLQTKIENDKALINNAIFSTLSAPLKAFGYAGKKINETLLNFSDNQKQRLSTKIQRVVDQEIKIQSLPTLANATEAYLYTEQEPDLAELFENLIANTVDRTKNVHPSFVEILKQLSSKDASLLKMLFPYLFDSEIAICSILFYREEQQFTYVYRNLLSFTYAGTNEPYIEQDLPIIIDNLIRLQLVTVEYGKSVVGVDYETAFRNRPEYQQFEQILRDGESLELEYGVLMITDFGRAFYKAVQSTTDSQID
ncbi:DUF4393 domain-containing protein [Glaesserella parasuis]|uniref:DUF4393 domain-containing protein n=1 Tax=Glaesserella parasuis TaxID=738 RepID=UPI0013F3B1DE|nr:DUF4393 domain-containing protein [Glaesserella parasuis]MCT8716084.1 DUF4393 domain-containing protein [Glaesserella parasuis]MCT8718023.1 DUF4393 domain-containing protein [Glaesserella parasuis]MCT8722309.1 DUF4393 domain-containing protein [Glaesserella parasuis]MCT8724223.1 DUF4393 domain-containing protein [Glaesserella parasuis]MDG6473740.1 DUF4393 domain-containing protein [Glaesserella parasuis]